MATEKTTQILEEIKALTILELADLVKSLEEEFGVSAAPVAVAAAGAAPAAAATEEKNKAKSWAAHPLQETSAGHFPQSTSILCFIN